MHSAMTWWISELRNKAASFGTHAAWGNFCRLLRMVVTGFVDPNLDKFVSVWNVAPKQATRCCLGLALAAEMLEIIDLSEILRKSRGHLYIALIVKHNPKSSEGHGPILGPRFLIVSGVPASFPHSS